MATYYAAVEAFDPAGQDLLPEDADYGGEARFFVLQAEDLAQTLLVLADTIAANGLRLDRVLHAADTDRFEEDLLPYDVDLAGMIAAASESGEVCVSEAQIFEPAEDPRPTGVYACGIDAFDPEWADEDEGNYAGHYQLAVIRAESATDALAELVGALEEGEVHLLMLEGLTDAAAFPFDAYDFAFDEEDPVAEVQEAGGIILSNAYAYGPEDNPRYDA